MSSSSRVSQSFREVLESSFDWINTTNVVYYDSGQECDILDILAWPEVMYLARSKSHILLYIIWYFPATVRAIWAFQVMEIVSQYMYWY